VEHLFDAQWMVNHTAKNMKDTLDLASKLIFQTADANFMNRNVLSAIETGDILVYADNKPITQINNSKPDISALQNFNVMWQNLGQQITNTPDVTQGVSHAQPLTYGLGQILNNNANSLFEIMTENKGLAIEEMLRTYIIPFLKKQLKNTDEVVAILDDAGVQEIDSMYIPHEAIRRHNKKFTDALLQRVSQPLDPHAAPQPLPTFNAAQSQQDVQQGLSSLGNKRFFVPSDASDQEWADLFSDFEWDSIRVEITNENTDKQAVLQTLSTVLQTVASNPMILSNPNAALLFSTILRETGAISPIQLTTATSLPPPRPTIRVTEGVDYKDLPPDAQSQMLASVGIQSQPQPVSGGPLSASPK
jgi:hypothetical protein